ncbi:hypothetical protein L7F22_048667, partial [Adiantum nelumboides]|nr:hypothetical protein [Adiantum nelumboides]
MGWKVAGVGNDKIFKLRRSVIRDNITYARPGAKATLKIRSTLLDIVAPCALCPVIAYASVKGIVDS